MIPTFVIVALVLGVLLDLPAWNIAPAVLIAAAITAPDAWSPTKLGFETRAERDLMLVLHRPIEPNPESRHR